MSTPIPPPEEEETMQQTEARDALDWIVTRSNATSDERPLLAALTARGHGPIMAMSYPTSGLECVRCGYALETANGEAVLFECNEDEQLHRAIAAQANRWPEVSIEVIRDGLAEVVVLRRMILDEYEDDEKAAT